MINSEEFGMSFWFNDEQDLCYCPTFISGEPDFDNTGYVEEWDDWSEIMKQPTEKKAMHVFFEQVELEAARLELTCDYYMREFCVT